jgi:lipopolysaccharide export system permease protein
MFVVTKYILREHMGPFVYGLLTIVFVFILNLVFRDLGRLLGKGLPASVIVEFFVFNLAWMLALAIPMAVLVATLMAFGRLSSENEIAALKAGGIHFYRMIAPVLVVAGLLTFAMERFNNCVLPDFNHRVRLLTSDISRKRPTLTLEPHVFFDEIPDYSLLVHEIKEEGNVLKEIIINNHSDPRYNETIIAENGRLTFSEEQEKLKFSLFSGEIHKVELEDLENYTIVKFETQVLSIPVDNMVLKRSNSQSRGQREKSAAMMREDIEKNLEKIRIREEQILGIVQRNLDEVFPVELWPEEGERKEKRTSSPQRQWRGKSSLRIQGILQQIQGERRIIRGYRRSISALRVEVHKKYSIPVACIIFVLIGAPLGVMARQGGLATGGVLSLVFFLIYWTFLIGGEQLADRRLIGPAVAMWAPNLLVGIGGVLLVVRSVRETTFIPWERCSLAFKRIFHRRKR